MIWHPGAGIRYSPSEYFLPHVRMTDSPPKARRPSHPVLETLIATFPVFRDGQPLAATQGLSENWRRKLLDRSERLKALTNVPADR